MSIKTHSRSSSARDADPQPPDDEAGASQANVNRIESHTLVQADSVDARHTLIAEAALPVEPVSVTVSVELNGKVNAIQP